MLPRVAASNPDSWSTSPYFSHVARLGGRLQVHRGHRVLGAGADTPPFLACSVPTPKWCFQPAGQTGTEEKNGPHQSRRQPSYHAAVPHARYSPQVVFPPSGAHLRELTLKPANFGTAAPQSTTLRAARRWTEKCKTAQTLT